MWRIFPVFLCFFLFSGCATIGQKNHGQPFVLPDDLKEQIAGKRIRQVEGWKHHGGCTQEVPVGTFHIPREAWGETATMIDALEQPGDYEIRYVFWNCEQFDGVHQFDNSIRRSFFNFMLSVFSAGIIPTFYDTYSNLTVTVTRDQQQVFQGTYRELTGGRIYGLIAIPLKLVEWSSGGPVKESTQLTSYRNLARQFNQDVATEFIFE